MKIGIIGGTGVYALHHLTDVKEIEIETPYGSVFPSLGFFEGKEVVFLPRHGKGHSVPPHRVNYRAIVYGLKAWGAEYVFSTAACGSLRKDFKPGDLIVLSSFIDFTKGRVSTFFEGGEEGVVHTDVTEPYCLPMRKIIYDTGLNLGIPVHPSGVYVCFEGPRFETPAEIKACQILGGDLVGMTNVPEVVLAKEAGLHYSTIAISTNYAAGISSTPLSHEEVLEVMESAGKSVTTLIMESIKRLTYSVLDCNCSKNRVILPGLKHGSHQVK